MCQHLGIALDAESMRRMVVGCVVCPSCSPGGFLLIDVHALGTVKKLVQRLESDGAAKPKRKAATARCWPMIPTSGERCPMA